MAFEGVSRRFRSVQGRLKTIHEVFMGRLMAIQRVSEDSRDDSSDFLEECSNGGVKVRVIGGFIWELLSPNLEFSKYFQNATKTQLHLPIDNSQPN